tara:strand:- start:3994 stop:4386 length:393 start_codon:yes stop_codon:yes gene_type:complete
MPDVKIEILERLAGTDEVLLYDPLVREADHEERGQGDEYYNRPDYLSLSRLLICNTDNTDITVLLYLKDSSNVTTHLLQGTLIPTSCTLDFNNGIPVEFNSDLKLCIKLGDAGFLAEASGMITGTMKYNN